MTAPATNGNGRPKTAALKHNVRGQVVAMLEEEIPAVEEKIAALEEQLAGLKDWRGYLTSVGKLSGYEPTTITILDATP